ncbi:Glucosamine kinase [Micromonospora saelicesensis]|uniref:Glucosamine kinase n=1 Tax=Micromonospora saelicesensis TaxID=285676 RepID=A0A328NWX2_9ACTN|nr:BadF/BadG/BcrA/BcrD ATPase family protein [Micromonospora saelicesensis]RAO37552.1 Glucosamine kinase [Micromonospora saelicesensis]
MVLVLGVDAGGTASRAVVATRDGTVVGRGAAGPGNPTAAGTAAARSIGAAVREALGEHDPASVGSGVAGIAGAGIMADPEITAAFSVEWAQCGLTCPVTLVGDAVTAFAAGTSAPSGAVLIAGTGAVAARIDDWRVSRTVDGLGWLLGDEGSGMWLGLQAVRSVARAWSGPTVDAGLAATIAAQAGVTTCDELVQWAGRQHPAAFAALAPLVCAGATAGDALAERLTTEAAARLVATLSELGPPDGPVVLAGSLLTNTTPVRTAVLATLAGPAATAGDPAIGAAWLALRQITDQEAAARLHHRMLRPDREASLTGH